MNSVRTAQPRLRAWGAAALSTLLVAGCFTLGAAPAYAEPVADPPSDIDPAAETTPMISDTGFVGAGAASGVYVNLGTSATFAAHALSATDRTLDSFTAAAQGCTVADGTLAWGFKEAFRSYISGTIANGEWTVADGAQYETPLFGWDDGEGSYNHSTGEGIVGYTGSIRFTGHGGILDTTVANPQVRLVDETRGVLLLDVTGETQQGVEVREAAVEFADLDLSTATITEGAGSVTIEGVAATLSEEGAAAFGTYEAGEALDDLTVKFSTEDCALVTDVSESADAGENTAAAADLSWLAWAIPVGLVVLAGIVIVVLLVRRAPQ